MKKLILITICICTTLHIAQAQNSDSISAKKLASPVDSAPYLKFPELPAFNILSIDSVTLFNTYNIPKGKPVALLFFDPDCKHCKANIQELTKKMDSLRNVDFYLFSARHDLSMIRTFVETHKLASYPNIKIVGMDKEFFFFSYYKVKFVPDLALYDSNKKLIKLLQGEFTVKELYELTHNEGTHAK